MNYRVGMAIGSSWRYYQLRPRCTCGCPQCRAVRTLPLVFYAIPTWYNGDGPYRPVSPSTFGLN